MTLQPGTRLGPYEVLSPLGAGGMGEVYRARDTRLNRDVALKVLPDLFADDPERLARFQREAQVLASINHPNIAAIHGLEEADGVRALVLELVEGVTLAELLGTALDDAARSGSGARQAVGVGPRGQVRKAGALPLEDALPIARQIAEALEAAHERGVIHRDLKPANIKLRPDGTVKVLDFGLARAFDRESGGDPAMSPTLTDAATRMGVILGTAAYMAPEQAKGKVVDKRADVWAFGCVVFEMLTGKRTFEGEDISDTLAFVITREPDWSALPADTPPAIRRLLRRCLEKDRKRRLHDIADARLEIEELVTGRAHDTAWSDVSQSSDVAQAFRPASGAAAAVRASVWRRALPWVTGALGIACGALALWIAMRSSPAGSAPVQRLTIQWPPSAPYIGEAGGELAVSPDGTRFAYVAGTGERLLYIRALDQLDAAPMRGTEGAYAPFFSPDGEWVGFYGGAGQAGKLKKISVRGGPAITLCDAIAPVGAVWGADNSIIFATGTSTGPGWALFRVSAAGGSPAHLTRPDDKKKEARHAWPELLPDGKTVLFSVAVGRPTFEEAHIAALSLESGKYETVVEQGYHARYVPTGHLVYVLAGNLMAVPFDVDRLQTTGPPVPVLEGIRGRSTTGEIGFAVSRTGYLIYAPGGISGGAARTVVWVDREGREEPIAAPPRAYGLPRLSPDGTRLVLDVLDEENDIWIWDLARQTLTRLTFDAGRDNGPVWTPDGRRVVYASDRGGSFNLYWQAADGTGQPERLTESQTAQAPSSFSPDGKRLLLRETLPKTVNDLLMLALDGERRTIPLVQTPFSEMNAEVSPDGRWLAYQSNESGQNQIYVRPFPDVNGGRWQISTEGGNRPLWARDGKELLYLAGGSRGSRMMSVAIPSGASFSAGNPRVVFEGRYVNVGPSRTYDVSLDGRRFVMIKEQAAAGEPAAPSHFVVVLNWIEELRRLAPGTR